MSQQVADALHTGQAVISNIENGKAGLDVEILLKFAGFYNVEPQQLLTDNSLVMNFHEKVENGYASYIQTLNADNEELLQALKEQLTIKD